MIFLSAAAQNANKNTCDPAVLGMDEELDAPIRPQQSHTSVGQSALSHQNLAESVGPVESSSSVPANTQKAVTATGLQKYRLVVREKDSSHKGRKFPF